MTEPFDVHALWAALDDQRRARSMSWAAIGRATGVSPSTLTRTQHALDLEADGMVQMTRWLEVAPEAFCLGVVHDAGGAIAEEIDAPDIDPPGIMRVDTVAMYAALDDRRRSDSMSWAEVADSMESRRATPEALKGLRRGGRVSVQVLLSVTRWLGVSCHEFYSSSPGG